MPDFPLNEPWCSMMALRVDIFNSYTVVNPIVGFIRVFQNLVPTSYDFGYFGLDLFVSQDTFFDK